MSRSFFLTSGFVIPFSLQQRTLGGFFLRRLFRLYPVHWLGLALVLAIVTWHSAALGIPFRYSLMNIVVNGILVNPYLGHAEINSVTWTLVVEELFYAGAALLAWRRVLDRRSILLTFAAVAVIACMLNPLAFPMGQRVHTAVQALLHNALLVVYIMIGVGFHWWYRGRWSARAALTTAGLLWAGFILAILVVSRTGDPTPAGQISTQPLIPIVSFTVALIVFITLMLVRNHLPHNKVVDWLSNISYPMYVFHMFLGFNLLYVFASWTGSYWVALGGTMLILLVLTSAVHIFVENPCNEFGRRLSARLGWEHSRRRGPKPGLVLTPN